MTRPLRIQYPGAWYHVMNRGAGRQKIFNNNTHREKFLKLIEEITSIYDIEVHCYCLMSNHYHLLLHTPLGNLSDGMRHLNSNYTKYYNYCCNRDGSLFRGRYKSILVSGDNYLLRLSRYIHQNPIKAGISKNIKDYIWSSYPAYIGKRVCPKWLHVKHIEQKFYEVRKELVSYREFVEKQEEHELVDIFDKLKMKPILGDKKFRDFIASKINGNIISLEIPDVKKLYELPSVEKITYEVAEYFNVTLPQILNPINKAKNTPRIVAIVLCRELGKFKLQEIADQFNNITYKYVSKVISKAKSSPEIMQHVEIIKSKIQKS